MLQNFFANELIVICVYVHTKEKSLVARYEILKCLRYTIFQQKFQKNDFVANRFLPINELNRMYKIYSLLIDF